MDLNAIKAKLSALNNNGQEREKTDYSTIFWKPELGKQTVRIVPSAYDPTFPFKELKFHYGIGNILWLLYPTLVNKILSRSL